MKRPKWPKDLHVTAVLLLMVQFLFLTRKPLRVKDKFFDKLCQNIRTCKFDKVSENKLIAMALQAASSRSNHAARINISFKAMDLITQLVGNGYKHP